jgi:hypothetical protein
MNTRFFFVLLAVALLITACAPAIADAAAPVEPAAPPADIANSVIVPVTAHSASTVANGAQESRQWSGEIFLSDNNAPDKNVQNDGLNIKSDTQQTCTSEDSQNRRYGGCVE